MKTSESINSIAPAVVKMQSQLENAEKTGNNPHFKSRYSTLAAVMEALREPLFKNGLAIIQAAETPWLLGQHTVFGQVTQGLDVLDAIANAPRDASDKPKSPWWK